MEDRWLKLKPRIVVGRGVSNEPAGRNPHDVVFAGRTLLPREPTRRKAISGKSTKVCRWLIQRSPLASGVTGQTAWLICPGNHGDADQKRINMPTNTNRNDAARETFHRKIPQGP